MEVPKGKLIAIGGAVDIGVEDEGILSEKNTSELFELGILSRVMKEIMGEDPRMEVITTASEIPEEIGVRYVDAFGRLGYKNIGIIHISEREEAANEKYIERIRRTKGVLFTGGNQLKLTTTLGGTDFLKEILTRYQNDSFVVAGTSAGAMAMSNTMIYHGSSPEALLKGEVKLSRGLGFIKDVTFDSHFVRRGRFGRLFQAVATNPVCVGIGLGENTGLLITRGNEMEAIGTGLVIIVDGINIKHNSIASIDEGKPISLENLIVHILSNGDGYILSERKFIPARQGQAGEMEITQA